MCDGESSPWSLVLHPELNRLANQYDYSSHHPEGWKTGHRVANHIGTRGAILLGHCYQKMYRVSVRRLPFEVQHCRCIRACVWRGGNLRLLDEWSTETITIIVPRQHELSWMLKLRTIPKSAWTCVDYNAFVETEWLLLRRCNLSNIDGRVYVRDRVSVRVIFSITWYVPDTVTYVWQVAAS